MGLTQKRQMKGVVAFLNDEDNEDVFIASISEAVATVVAVINEKEPHRQGSIGGRSENQFRDRDAGQKLLLEYYFQPDETFEAKFRRQFRMRRQLFEKIVADIEEHDHYFQQKALELRVFHVYRRWLLHSESSLTVHLLILLTSMFELGKVLH